VCVLLAACSPVKLGSAAIVGNQRITSATLDSDVSSLQQAVAKFGGNQISAGQQPQAVLTWLVRFAIRDKVAGNNGITVNQTQVDSALTQLNAELQQSAAQNGSSYSGLAATLADNGLPPNLVNALGQWEAQETAYVQKVNGGKLPTTQTGAQNAVAKLTKADCQAANSLKIQVSPQYGQLNFDSSAGLYTVSAPKTLLSLPEGAKAATPSPSLPSC
jgi:peptidyl-prolyl cis-trans isomerase SurA